MGRRKSLPLKLKGKKNVSRMLAAVELLHWLGPPWITRKRIATEQPVHKIVAIYSQLDIVPIALQHKLRAWFQYKKFLSKEELLTLNCHWFSLWRWGGLFCATTSTSSWTTWRAWEGWWGINREEECDYYRHFLPYPAGDLCPSNFTVCKNILPYLFSETTL